MSYCIGTDIGGTFTDCVVIDEKGTITIAKSPSVPKKFAEGLMNVLEEAAAKLGIKRRELLKDAKLFSHGTTIAANTLINRSGARIGLITTKGFEETLFIMRGSSLCQGLPIQDWYHCNQNERPFELIPKDRIIGVNQRMDSRGEELVRLNEEEARSAVKVLVEEKGCEAISVCYLWSTVNPIHEVRTREIIEKLYPKIFVSTSHEVIAIMGEYERASTTALNSYVRPAVEEYVDELDQRLKEEGLSVPFLLMQSNGGLLPAMLAATSAITILESGPTGGVMAGKIIGELVGKENIITTDMGGTSFDVSLIAKGEIHYTKKSYHERHAVASPMADIETIGAGGGSIVYLENGVLKVGPMSAGMDPGPICYGRGGTSPTVTDVDLILGYINPDYFLGGKMKLEKELAERYLKEQIADPLGVSVVEAADGIHRIINSHMSDCIRFHAIQRGYDPRDFDLLAFGGAGPMHAIGYGEELGVRSIIVPLSGVATVLSAFGIGNSDILRFYFSSVPMSLELKNIAELNRIYKEMEERGYRDLGEMGFKREDISVLRTAGMRYHLQLTELDISIPLGIFNDESIGEIMQVFDKRYAELYGETAGYKEAGRDIISEFVRVTARTPKGKIEASRDGHPKADHALKGTRKAYFSEVGDFVETKIYDGESLQAGNQIPGPAILEMAGTTVVITPSYTAEFDRYRNIILKRAGRH